MAKATKELKAGGLHPGTLLKNDVQYRAPIFQRHYVWKAREFETLWKDLLLLQEEGGEVESRFLGALVLEDQGGGLSTDPDEYLIVDGQQRLLTLTLLLVAIAEQASLIGTPEGKEYAVQLTKLWVLNQATRISDEAKVLPTLSDYAQFVAVMTRLKSFASPKLPIPYGPETGELTRMYERARKSVREVTAAAAIGSATPQDAAAAKLAALDHLATTLLNKLKFVEIVLGSDDDPHHVFDRLNDAGIKLDVADLIRNDVFLRLTKNPMEAQHVHDQEWTPFEASLKGHLSDFVFPYALIKKSSTTKGRMIADLRDHWNDWDASKIISDLAAYVPSFLALAADQIGPELLPKGSAALEGQIRRLARMPVPSSVYPYAMMLVKSAADGAVTPAAAERCLLIIESFLVRRAINGTEPTGLHALFKGMWSKVGADAVRLVAEIDSKPTIKSPSDELFASDIRTQPLYGKRIAPYILAEYDRSLAGDPTPAIAPTIDHVMPQKLGAGWSVTASDHARLLHVWGNLVPLSGPGNSAKGTETWTNVRKRLLKESGYKTPRQLAMDYSTWGPKQIEKRTQELVAWALLRWPRS